MRRRFVYILGTEITGHFSRSDAIKSRTTLRSQGSLPLQNNTLLLRAAHQQRSRPQDAMAAAAFLTFKRGF